VPEIQARFRGKGRTVHPAYIHLRLRRVFMKTLSYACRKFGLHVLFVTWSNSRGKVVNLTFYLIKLHPGQLAQERHTRHSSYLRSTSIIPHAHRLGFKYVKYRISMYQIITAECQRTVLGVVWTKLKCQIEA
jgi:hypothetical protein